MSIDIKCESGGSVAQILLNSLDVISTFDCQNSVGMASIVKSGRGRANLVHNSLKAIIDSAVGKKDSGLIGENQVVFLPAIPGFQAHPILL